MAGRLFDRAEVETLLREGKVGPLEGFRSKMGRKFNATVKLGEDFKQQFDFGENGNGGPLRSILRNIKRSGSVRSARKARSTSSRTLTRVNARWPVRKPAPSA